MKFKAFVSLFIAILMIFSTMSVAFAAESPDTVTEFGDVLYSGEGITVFYGNPSENEELAEEIENQYARSLQYDYAWVDAYDSGTYYAYITASTSNPITYFNIKQESNSAVPYSRVTVTRPTNDGRCYYSVWDGRSEYQTEDMVISTSTLWNQGFLSAYKWTTGTLTLRWDVEAGSSGARMCLWAW